MTTFVLIRVPFPLCIPALDLKTAHLAIGAAWWLTHAYTCTAEKTETMNTLAIFAVGIFLIGAIHLIACQSCIKKRVFPRANLNEMKKLGRHLAGYSSPATAADIFGAGALRSSRRLLDSARLHRSLNGRAIHFVSWIMDEGQKNKQEQELTF